MGRLSSLPSCLVTWARRFISITRVCLLVPRYTMFADCSDVGGDSCEALEVNEEFEFVSSAVCSLLGVVSCGGMFSLFELVRVSFMCGISSLLEFVCTLCLARGTVGFTFAWYSCVG